MNHDYAHCSDWTKECPKDCFRAQLVRDLRKGGHRFPVSWMRLKGTEECPKWGKEGEKRIMDFEVGEYIVYVNGDKYELGRIKSLCRDGAFVAYHEGETGAKTPYGLMHKLANGYVIAETTLGGDFFN